jgi:hypothetical protein
MPGWRQPDATLADVLRILDDKAYRSAVVPRIRNEQVRQFWITEYDHYPPRMKAEAIAPIQNRCEAQCRFGGNHGEGIALFRFQRAPVSSSGGLSRLQAIKP